MSGRDEQDCPSPESCQAWWDAGYHDSGVYNIRKLLSNAKSRRYGEKSSVYYNPNDFP